MNRSFRNALKGQFYVSPGQGHVSVSKIGRSPGLNSFIFIGRAVRSVYRKGVTEAETELAQFRPHLREFVTPSEHSADVRFLDRNPGLRPLGAGLALGYFRDAPLGLFLSVCWRSILSLDSSRANSSPVSSLQPLPVTRATKFPE